MPNCLKSISFGVVAGMLAMPNIFAIPQHTMKYLKEYHRNNAKI